MKSLTRILRPAGLAAAFSLLAMPALAAQPEDAWITTKVKMALLTDDTVDGLDINVDTFSGRVTLHGKVDSSVEKAEAERLARQVAGVADVRNLLAVVAGASRKANEVSDEALARAGEHRARARQGAVDQRHRREVGEQGRGSAVRRREDAERPLSRDRGCACGPGRAPGGERDSEPRRAGGCRDLGGHRARGTDRGHEGLGVGRVDHDEGQGAV